MMILQYKNDNITSSFVLVRNFVPHIKKRTKNRVLRGTLAHETDEIEVAGCRQFCL
jgi:hypothetical protein